MGGVVPWVVLGDVVSSGCELVGKQKGQFWWEHRWLGVGGRVWMKGKRAVSAQMKRGRIVGCGAFGFCAGELACRRRQ